MFSYYHDGVIDNLNSLSLEKDKHVRHVYFEEKSNFYFLRSETERSYFNVVEYLFFQIFNYDLLSTIEFKEKENNDFSKLTNEIIDVVFKIRFNETTDTLNVENHMFFSCAISLILDVYYNTDWRKQYKNINRSNLSKIINAPKRTAQKNTIMFLLERTEELFKVVYPKRKRWSSDLNSFFIVQLNKIENLKNAINENLLIEAKNFEKVFTNYLYKVYAIISECNDIEDNLPRTSSDASNNIVN